jgi:hypothetical protein
LFCSPTTTTMHNNTGRRRTPKMRRILHIHTGLIIRMTVGMLVCGIFALQYAPYRTTRQGDAGTVAADLSPQHYTRILYMFVFVTHNRVNTRLDLSYNIQNTPETYIIYRRATTSVTALSNEGTALGDNAPTCIMNQSPCVCYMIL